MEVTNRLKVLGLVECLINYGWKLVNTVQEAVTKTIPQKKKCKKAKWLSEEALQIAEEETQKAGEKGRDIPN